MKYITVTVLFAFLSPQSFSQTTGPVYKFNFYNDQSDKNSNLNTTPNAQTMNLATTTDSEKKEQNYFSQSLLDPADDFTGVSLQYISGKNKKKGLELQVYNMEYLVGLFGSYTRVEDYSDEVSNISKMKLGIIKLAPFNNHIALEMGASYTMTKVTLFDYRYNYSNFVMERYSYPWKSPTVDALIGIKYYAGNIVAGLSFERPVYEINNKRTLTEDLKDIEMNMKLGIYF